MGNSINEANPDISQKTLMMVSLGCAKNLVDSENMCQIVKDAGIRLVLNPAEANIIVVNTCGFIESAKKEAIDKILEMAQYKQTNCDFLIVAGCLAQRYSKEIKEQLPEADAILGTAAYGSIMETIEALYNGMDSNGLDDMDASYGDPKRAQPPIVHTEGIGSLLHLSATRTPTTKGYAYIKIAEGCSNRCSYCAIPDIRGAFQSRSMEELVAEAAYLAGIGIYEVVLIAQDTTRYGLDIYGRPALPSLIHRISEIEKIQSIRILYCYADGITDELIQEMRNNLKVANYIEMPIQHANNNMLRRMNRRDTKEKIAEVIRDLRKAMPDIIIRTTVMVGFPGETDKEFDDLLQFIKKMKFDLMGCFIYSAEEGTPAYRMKPGIPKKIAKKRYNIIMSVQKDIIAIKNNKIINKKFEITIESITSDGVFYLGRSYAQAPEIDPMILIAATIQPLEIGKKYWTKIVETADYDLIGVTIQ